MNTRWFIYLSAALLLTFLLSSCHKNKEYQLPEEYGRIVWKCSVSEEDWTDTLAAPDLSGFSYEILFTEPKPSDINLSYAIQHWIDNNLIHCQIVHYEETINENGIVRTKYHLKNRKYWIVYQVPNGTGLYNYEYPFERINGIPVKNIFEVEY